MDLKTDTLFPASSTSLITRASQILALFIALGLAGMISSILISENINSGAAKINLAGSLRMLATKVSSSQSTGGIAGTKLAVEKFQSRLELVSSQSQLDFKSDVKLAAIYKEIERKWLKVKNLSASLTDHEELYLSLDHLVSHLQLEIEKEIKLLRLIQYAGFFTIVLISYITIYRLQGNLIAPFRLLMQVAKEAGQGNFTPRADEKAKGELGMLAKSLNEMAGQLSLTYQDFEQKVALKTAELEQSNRSLSILYRSAHSLSSREQADNIERLLSDLKEVIGTGEISVHLNEQEQLPISSSSKSESTLLHFYPINKHDHSFGTLVWKTQSYLSPEPWQEELLKAMSNLIASSADLEYKRRTESRLEILEERAVIARELHDSLAQSLSYLKLQISLLNKQFQKGLPQEQVSSTISEISNGTNQAYKQLREILTTFRLKLDGDSIENSIRDAIQEFTEKCDHDIKLNCDLGANALSPHQEIHLLQIIRESLSNIHKHAQASTATVNIKACDNEVYVEIDDNGCGRPETTSKEGHFGLKIMGERAKSLGGLLQFSQNTPSGTRVSLRFKIISEN